MTVMLSYSRTIVPTANFNGERGAIKLQKAMKGLGSDEKVIIEVMTSHSNAQRQEIKKKYKALYSRDLSDDIKGELGGHFESLCLALLASEREYLVECLQIALNGNGRDVLEILVPLQPNERVAIVNEYREKYGSEIEIKEEHFRAILNWLLESNGEVDSETVSEDAQLLKQIASENAEALIKFLHSRSLEQLKAAIELNDTIEEEAKSLFTSDEQIPYLILIKLLRNECDYFAERLNSCFQGIDSDDSTIVRILTTHSETNLGDIKERYRLLFGKDLSEAVADDTSGDYRKLLLKILN